MVENWNEKFAFYAVALYRVGNYTDAALVGSIMFEKAIYTLLERKGIDKDFVKNDLKQKKSNKSINKYTGELQYATILTCSKYPNYTQREFDRIRKLRNDITHQLDIDEIKRESIEPMVALVWKILDESSFNQYSGKINNIDFLTADYTVVGMREMFNENLQDMLAKDYQFNNFELEDFQELYKLRDKMISLGSKIKKEILKIHYKDELYIDIISKVDTTSAYVWMSMNLRNKKRERINSASVSILGTPLDLRIYFDIGGGAYQVRQDYYKFLRSDYFANFQDNLNLKDMEIFDNDWYCFIVDRVPLSALTPEDMNYKILKAENKLAEYNDNSKITWNRMLCGYIIERGEISFENIKNKLEVIIELYYCFEYFRQRELQRKIIPFEYNISDKCRKRIRPITYDAKSLNIRGIK